jgi:hypothetical protein
MKALRKNLRKLWIANPSGDLVEIVNEDGLGTGEWEYPYETPVEVRGNVGVPGGKRGTGDAIVLSDFGLRERYDRIVVLYDKSLPITETTRLWVDKNPSEGTYDYEPVRIMKSLNSLLVAVKKVTVSG